MLTFSDIQKSLGNEADSLLNHICDTVPNDQLYLPSPDWLDRIHMHSDRNIRVLRSLQSLFNHGRLAGTGYLSILPVDQGIEHPQALPLLPIPSISTRKISSN